jgi:L-aminopeptidase/D-esterase-like protein
LGDVIDRDSRRTLAGVLTEDKAGMDDTCRLVLENRDAGKNVFSGNTTLGCVITNARLTKPQANKLAALSQNGYAEVIRPVHTMSDGDTVFALAQGQVEADPLAVGILAQEAVARAVNRAVLCAQGAYGLKCASDFQSIGL